MLKTPKIILSILTACFQQSHLSLVINIEQKTLHLRRKLGLFHCFITLMFHCLYIITDGGLSQNLGININEIIKL